MITVKKLCEFLAKLPDDAQVYAYEGEDVGLGICIGEQQRWWIRARDTTEEDDYASGFEGES